MLLKFRFKGKDKPIGKTRVFANQHVVDQSEFAVGKVLFFHKDVPNVLVEDSVYTLEGVIKEGERANYFIPFNYGMFGKHETFVKQSFEKPNCIIIDEVSGIFLDSLSKSVKEKCKLWLVARNQQKSVRKRSNLVFIPQELFDTFWKENYE